MGSVTENIFYYETTDLPNDVSPSAGYGAKSLREATEAAITPGSFTYDDYRRDVLASLVSKYGASSVTEGNKAITVAGNTYRLDADVLPCTSFRWYYKNWRGQASYHEGISFFTTSNDRIVNFPKQHFENLSEKDQRNDNKVKGCIRIMKRLRNELEDAGAWDRKRSPSFYLESLIWNVPDDNFIGGYPTVLENVLTHLYADLREKRGTEALRSYMQANNIFILFHPDFWNVDDAIAFLEAIWNAAFQA